MIAKESAAHGAGRRSCAPCRPRDRRTGVRGVKSIQRFEQSALDVAALRNRQYLGMVERLTAKLTHRDAPPAVGGGRFEHLEEERLGEMVAAARGEEGPTRREQSHRPEVDLLVAAKRRGERITRLRERRRIEHNGVE